MSRYTTELRYVIEQSCMDLGIENVEANWPKIYDAIGLADYPIFSEDYRTTLNDNIIRMYYMREIGGETVEQFRMFLRRTMFLEMPYFNKMYEAQLAITNPFSTKDMTRDDNFGETVRVEGTTDRTQTTGTTNDASSTNSDRNVYIDTPMSTMPTDKEALMAHPTSVTFNDGEETSNSQTDVNDKENTSRVDNTNRTHALTSREHGRDGSMSELLIKYRSALQNIDMQVIERINNCFMGVY